MKFIFNPETDVVRNPSEHMGSYGYDEGGYEQFHEQVIAMIGEEIVKLTKVLAGYYDITFESGNMLHGISAHSITIQPM